MFDQTPRHSRRDYITNEEVKARIGNAIGPYEDLLFSVKRCKLQWYGHVTRSSGLAQIREQFKEGNEEADRGSNGKTASKSGLALNGISYRRKPRTARMGRKLVVKSTVVPQRSARLRDR